MRKDRGLAGVGEGEREGTPYQQNQDSLPTKSRLPTNKIKTISVLKQHSVGFFQQNQDLHQQNQDSLPTKSRLTPTKSRLSAF